MNTEIKIGNNIKKLRELKNYTQEYIAERLGMSVTAYGRIERDESNPSLNRLQQIAEELAVPLNRLFEPIGQFIFQDAVSNSQIGSGNYYHQPGGSPELLVTILQTIQQQMEQQTKLLMTIEKIFERSVTTNE